MKVKIFYDGIDFRLKGWKKIRDLIVRVISEEGNFSGDLNFILADDNAILNINRQFLNHNWFTDVISFNYGKEEKFGEVYISVDTVRTNALNYNVSYKREILRVMIHGTLHICGYEDDTERKKLKMHEREDYWLNIFDKSDNGA
ncbi:MAG: rRNA maturation RNase YbeY [Bacteroidales bacterium]